MAKEKSKSRDRSRSKHEDKTETGREEKKSRGDVFSRLSRVEGDREIKDVPPDLQKRLSWNSDQKPEKVRESRELEKEERKESTRSEKREHKSGKKDSEKSEKKDSERQDKRDREKSAKRDVEKDERKEERSEKKESEKGERSKEGRSKDGKDAARESSKSERKRQMITWDPESIKGRSGGEAGKESDKGQKYDASRSEEGATGAAAHDIGGRREPKDTVAAEEQRISKKAAAKAAEAAEDGERKERRDYGQEAPEEGMLEHGYLQADQGLQRWEDGGRMRSGRDRDRDREAPPGLRGRIEAKHQEAYNYGVEERLLSPTGQLMGEEQGALESADREWRDAAAIPREEEGKRESGRRRRHAEEEGGEGERSKSSRRAGRSERSEYRMEGQLSNQVSSPHTHYPLDSSALPPPPIILPPRAAEMERVAPEPMYRLAPSSRSEWGMAAGEWDTRGDWEGVRGGGLPGSRPAPPHITSFRDSETLSDGRMRASNDPHERGTGGLGLHPPLPGSSKATYESERSMHLLGDRPPHLLERWGGDQNRGNHAAAEPRYAHQDGIYDIGDGGWAMGGPGKGMMANSRGEGIRGNPPAFRGGRNDGFEDDDGYGRDGDASFRGSGGGMRGTMVDNGRNRWSDHPPSHLSDLPPSGRAYPMDGSPHHMRSPPPPPQISRHAMPDLQPGGGQMRAVNSDLPSPESSAAAMAKRDAAQAAAQLQLPPPQESSKRSKGRSSKKRSEARSHSPERERKHSKARTERTSPPPRVPAPPPKKRSPSPILPPDPQQLRCNGPEELVSRRQHSYASRLKRQLELLVFTADLAGQRLCDAREKVLTRAEAVLQSKGGLSGMQPSSKGPRSAPRPSSTASHLRQLYTSGLVPGEESGTGPVQPLGSGTFTREQRAACLAVIAAALTDADTSEYSRSSQKGHFWVTPQQALLAKC